MNIKYLNNSGSKWVIPGLKIRLICKADNYDKIRSVSYCEGFGNHSAFCLKYKGKNISVLAQTEENGIPICYVNSKEYYDNLCKL